MPTLKKQLPKNKQKSKFTSAVRSSKKVKNASKIKKKDNVRKKSKCKTKKKNTSLRGKSVKKSKKPKTGKSGKHLNKSRLKAAILEEVLSKMILGDLEHAFAGKIKKKMKHSKVNLAVSRSKSRKFKDKPKSSKNAVKKSSKSTTDEPPRLKKLLRGKTEEEKRYITKRIKSIINATHELKFIDADNKKVYRRIVEKSGKSATVNKRQPKQAQALRHGLSPGKSEKPKDKLKGSVEGILAKKGAEEIKLPENKEQRKKVLEKLLKTNAKSIWLSKKNVGKKPLSRRKSFKNQNEEFRKTVQPIKTFTTAQRIRSARVRRPSLKTLVVPNLTRPSFKTVTFGNSPRTILKTHIVPDQLAKPIIKTITKPSLYRPPLTVVGVPSLPLPNKDRGDMKELPRKMPRQRTFCPPEKKILKPEESSSIRKSMYWEKLLTNHKPTMVKHGNVTVKTEDILRERNKRMLAPPLLKQSFKTNTNVDNDKTNNQNNDSTVGKNANLKYDLTDRSSYKSIINNVASFISREEKKIVKTIAEKMKNNNDVTQNKGEKQTEKIIDPHQIVNPAFVVKSDLEKRKKPHVTLKEKSFMSLKENENLSYYSNWTNKINHQKNKLALLNARAKDAKALSTRLGILKKSNTDSHSPPNTLAALASKQTNSYLARLRGTDTLKDPIRLTNNRERKIGEHQYNKSKYFSTKMDKHSYEFKPSVDMKMGRNELKNILKKPTGIINPRNPKLCVTSNIPRQIRPVVASEDTKEDKKKAERARKKIIAMEYLKMKALENKRVFEMMRKVNLNELKEDRSNQFVSRFNNQYVRS